MIRQLALLLVFFAVVSARQNCYSCTSAIDRGELQNWNWRLQNESFMTSNLKFKDDNCDIHPWAVGNTVDCGSMCLKWQFTYTDSGKTKYYTVRGCAEQLISNVPHTESCPQYQHTNGGFNAPGGGPPGEYRLCFCNGNLCNSATHTAAFGIAALLSMALFATAYH